MSASQWGMILIVLGAAIAFVSLMADTIGVGAQPGVIGWKQLLGTGAGGVMLIGGVVLLAQARSKGKTP